jgi:hypothetical protein
MSNYGYRLTSVRRNNINPLNNLIELKENVKKNTQIKGSNKEDILLRINKKILEIVEHLYSSFHRSYTSYNNLPIGEYQELIKALNSINLNKFENSSKNSIQRLKNNISANILKQQNESKEQNKYKNSNILRQQTKIINNKIKQL